jgi:hypothetical protein
MRKICLLGGAVIVTFAAANAYAMGPGGGDLTPDQSPYAILEPQTVMPSGLNEGRASYYPGNDAASASNPNAPSWSPYALMPQGNSLK